MNEVTYSFMTPCGTICGNGFHEFTTFKEAMDHLRYRRDVFKHDTSSWRLYKTTKTTTIKRELVELK